MPRRSFKTDTSFLEKISMGAIGTRRVYENLRAQGHNPIELERGSRAYKIWKQIKIKRIRVPDILCVRCGARFESRAKQNFELSMSHSLSDPERAWDAGLEDSDYVAFVGCSKVGPRPIDWEADELVQYFGVQELRQRFTEDKIIITKPKGAEEGFETRIHFPSMIANYAGTIKSISAERIQYRRAEDNRTITLRFHGGSFQLQPLVNEGDAILKNQVLGSVVSAMKEVACNPISGEAAYLQRLNSINLSQRYSAAKALSAFCSPNVLTALKEKLNQSEEHVYVKLEAAATLARQNEVEGWNFIENTLTVPNYEYRLEAVIILGEVKLQKSVEILSRILLDDSQPAEIRAGAAWALGEVDEREALEALIRSFMSVEQTVRIEAARALAKLSVRYYSEILEKFPRSSLEERPGIAWALSRSVNVPVENIIQLLQDSDARQWGAYILGSRDQRSYLNEIEKLKSADPEVYFAVTVLWKIMSSWIYEVEEF